MKILKPFTIRGTRYAAGDEQALRRDPVADVAALAVLGYVRLAEKTTRRTREQQREIERGAR